LHGIIGQDQLLQFGRSIGSLMNFPCYLQAVFATLSARVNGFHADVRKRATFSDDWGNEFFDLKT